LKSLNAELGIEVDFSHSTGTAPRNNRFRSNYQKRDYGSSSGGGYRNRFSGGRDYRSRNSSYGYGRGRDRDRDNDSSSYGYGRDRDSSYGHDNNDNGYRSRLKGITKPLGRRSNTREYSDSF
jgi:hypothetical protein